MCEARFRGRTRCERPVGHPGDHENDLFQWSDAQCDRVLTLEDLGFPSADPDPERDFAEEAFNAQLLREE